MRACSRVMAFLMVLLFLLSAPVSLIMWNVDNYLLAPDPYLQALEDEDFAMRLPSIAAEQIYYSLTYNPCLEDPQNCEGGEGALFEEGAAEGGPPSYLKELSVEQWRSILSTLLEPGWLEAQAETLLTDLFQNLAPGRSPKPIVISLEELKANLAGQQGVTLVEELLAAQPPCSAAQLLELAVMDFSQPDLERLLSCNPPPEVVVLVMPEIKAALDTAAGELPSEITIDAFDKLFDTSGTEGPGGSVLMRARLLMRISPFFPLTLMLLIGLLAVRSLRDLGWWIGLPLFLTGASTAAVGWFAAGVVDWAVQRFVVPVLPGMLSPLSSDFILSLVLRVGRLMADRVAFQAAVLVVLGAGMLVIGLLVRPKRRVKDIAPLTKPRGGANEGS
jgi:hypothetical protein